MKKGVGSEEPKGLLHRRQGAKSEAEGGSLAGTIALGETTQSTKQASVSFGRG